MGLGNGGAQLRPPKGPPGRIQNRMGFRATFRETSGMRSEVMANGNQQPGYHREGRTPTSMFFLRARRRRPGDEFVQRRHR